MDCHILHCPEFFHCKGKTMCTHPSEICDGKVDCTSEYKDDEIFCFEDYTCHLQCTCLGLGMHCHNISLLTIPNLEFHKFELLSITMNFIPVINKNEFHSFTHLRCLNVSHNDIFELSNYAFGTNMLYLKHLDLTGNKIIKFTKWQFTQLQSTKVHHLLLLENQLKEIHSWAFSGLTFLKVFDISNMQLNDIHNFAFANISHLNYLNISNNNLIHLKGKIFQDTNSLSILDISGNMMMREVPISILQPLSTLKLFVTSCIDLCCLFSSIWDS